MFVESFKEKLELLIKHDTVVTTRKALADELGVHPSVVTRWQNGGDYKERSGRVPDIHFSRILEVFNVDEEWLVRRKLDTETADLFVQRLESDLRQRRPRSGWQDVYLQAKMSENLAMKPAPQPTPRLSLRGVMPEAAPTDFLGPSFVIGERVYVDLTIRPNWERDDARLLAYVVVLLLGSSETQCLRPSSLFGTSSHETRLPTVFIPEGAPDSALKVTGPEGLYSLVAIVTREPLPASLCAELMRPDHPDLRICLARIAEEVLRRSRTDWHILKQNYYVHDSPNRIGS